MAKKGSRASRRAASEAGSGHSTKLADLAELWLLDLTVAGKVSEHAAGVPGS
jgi:hypothetical protein